MPPITWNVVVIGRGERVIGGTSATSWRYGATMAESDQVRLRTPAGRWVLFATVLGTSMAFLDATVVNIALPALGDDLDAGLSQLQWTINAYTLTLAGFLLLGGALGDRFGRRRVFVIGAVWFAVASLACGVAPTSEALIAGRALQGVGAALLTPGSLAIIEASFDRDDRGAAVGAWSGLGGIAGALGPFLGGYLIEAVSWRWIFLINLPIALAVVVVTGRHVPETRAPVSNGARLDVSGALVVAVALAALTFGLTAGDADGWTSGGVLATLAVGAVGLGAFVIRQRRAPSPLVPLELFASRQFSSANIVTFVVYAALAGALFLLPLQLQETAGYGAIAAGAALVPMTIVMLLLSSRAGRLAQRIGPRLPMSLGPIVAGAGFALLSVVDSNSPYLSTVFPGVLVISLGLSLTVAPLTSTVLAAGGEDHAGVSAAINNAVARTAGLIAVAVIPTAAGISAASETGSSLADGFGRGMWISGAVCVSGGLLAALTITNPVRPAAEPDPCFHCALDAPPLRPVEQASEPERPMVEAS
jgi:EmrB/QacA subfamily drug resistance transporter